MNSATRTARITSPPTTTPAIALVLKCFASATFVPPLPDPLLDEPGALTVVVLECFASATVVPPPPDPLLDEPSTLVGEPDEPGAEEPPEVVELVTNQSLMASGVWFESPR
jgi:membrane protein YqaA with SNARE-associated domain